MDCFVTRDDNFFQPKLFRSSDNLARILRNIHSKKSEHQRADADAMKNLDGEVLDRHSGQPLNRAEEMKLADRNAAQWERAAEQAARKAGLNKSLMDASEYTSLASTFAGMVLLVIFTISNMAR